MDIVNSEQYDKHRGKGFWEMWEPQRDKIREVFVKLDDFAAFDYTRNLTSQFIIDVLGLRKAVPYSSVQSQLFTSSYPRSWQQYIMTHCINKEYYNCYPVSLWCYIFCTFEQMVRYLQSSSGFTEADIIVREICELLHLLTSFSSRYEDHKKNTPKRDVFGDVLRFKSDASFPPLNDIHDRSIPWERRIDIACLHVNRIMKFKIDRKHDFDAKNGRFTLRMHEQFCNKFDPYCTVAGVKDPDIFILFLFSYIWIAVIAPRTMCRIKSIKTVSKRQMDIMSAVKDEIELVRKYQGKQKEWDTTDHLLHEFKIREMLNHDWNKHKRIGRYICELFDSYKGAANHGANLNDIITHSLARLLGHPDISPLPKGMDLKTYYWLIDELTESYFMMMLLYKTGEECIFGCALNRCNCAIILFQKIYFLLMTGLYDESNPTILVSYVYDVLLRLTAVFPCVEGFPFKEMLDECKKRLEHYTVRLKFLERTATEFDPMLGSLKFYKKDRKYVPPGSKNRFKTTSTPKNSVCLPIDELNEKRGPEMVLLEAKSRDKRIKLEEAIKEGLCGPGDWNEVNWGIEHGEELDSLPFMFKK